MPRCQACGREAPTKYIEFYQNIGMLVMRRTRSIKGNLCRRCIKKHFLNLTGMTLVTGWWGTISFIINPFLVLNNTIRYVGSLGLADGGGHAFPVQPPPVASSAARLAPPAPAARTAPPASDKVSIALQSFDHDIRMRLRGGQTPAEIARFVSPRSGVSVAAVQAYAENIRAAKAK